LSRRVEDLWRDGDHDAAAYLYRLREQNPETIRGKADEQAVFRSQRRERNEPHTGCQYMVQHNAPYTVEIAAHESVEIVAYCFREQGPNCADGHHDDGRAGEGVGQAVSCVHQSLQPHPLRAEHDFDGYKASL